MAVVSDPIHGCLLFTSIVGDPLMKDSKDFPIAEVLSQAAGIKRIMIPDYDLNRIEKNKAFLRRLWNLENEERPAFLIGYAGPKVRGGRPVRSAFSRPRARIPCATAFSTRRNS